MDHASAIEELLARHGFRRFSMSRTQVGHLKLVGHVDGRPIDIVLDTGASQTFVELGYCRSEGIASSDPGLPGHGGNVYTLGDVRLALGG
jgi:predicted aspartyl protease